MSCCQESLARLQTNYIDVYYLHRIDENGPYGASLEESMKAFSKLWLEGKILHVGISEANSEQIERAHIALLKYTNGQIGLTAVQSEYSLMTRGIEINGILSMCRKYGIGFVAYSPLSRQLLTDNLKIEELSQNDCRHSLPRFQDENFKKNKSIVNQLKKVAERKKCTVAQLSLAWVLAQGQDIVPIPGTKRKNYLFENIQASNIEFSNEELEIINKIAPPYAASGERYTPIAMQAYGLKE